MKYLLFLLVLATQIVAAPIVRAQVATPGPVSGTFNPGDPVTITVTASGTQPLGYQWYKNGVAIQGANASIYRIAAVAQADVGAYTAIITNSAGSTTSPAATLEVRNPPVVTGLTIDKK